MHPTQTSPKAPIAPLTLSPEEQAILDTYPPDQQAAIAYLLRKQAAQAVKEAKAVETPEQRDQRLSAAANKAWETRRTKDPQAPSRSAKKAWETRRNKEQAALDLAAQALTALRAQAAQAQQAPAPKAPKAKRTRKPKAA